MVSIDDYTCEKECRYKEEIYSVRDNGAVMRHAREGKRLRKDDNVWTFGKPNEKTGYMEIATERVHRIVAVAFHGEPPTKEYVVDHIDTNRKNNRPENLRWLTRLENALNNPITRARIENLCGSIENFLKDPSVLRNYEHVDSNFSWMRTVTQEEARASLANMTKWAKNPTVSQGGTLGEWIFTEKIHNKLSDYAQRVITRQGGEISQKTVSKEDSNLNVQQSLTPNAVQVNWGVPSDFPLCPQKPKSNPIEEYVSNLKKGEVFCRNERYHSEIWDIATTDNGNTLLVITHCDNVKPWALARITYNDGIYTHYNEGAYFEENGVRKYFILAQGLKWTGGDVFDDYC